PFEIFEAGRFVRLVMTVTFELIDFRVIDKLKFVGLKIFLPVPPALNKFAVIEIVLNQIVRYGQQYCCLRSGNRRDEMIRMRGGVGKTSVENNQFSAIGLAIDDALSVWIEVVP